MPPRGAPTAREARLGAELRTLRDRAGKTAREAGALLGTDQGKISNIESGQRGISEERIRRLALFYSCDDTELVDALCAMASEHRGKNWWDAYRGVLSPDFLDVAELEHHATFLRSVQTVSIPGLLQTENYARTLFRGGMPRLPPVEVEARTEQRMKRKAIFARREPPHFEAVIHEAALRMRFGGRHVTREQLDYLASRSELPGVTIRVIPFSNERFVETTHPVVYAGGVVPKLDTVRVEGPVGCSFLGAEAVLRDYRAIFEQAVKASLTPSSSLDLIRDIAREV